MLGSEVCLYTKSTIVVVLGADCSIVVVCAHGVRVVRVRFPAVRLGVLVVKTLGTPLFFQ